MGNTPKDIAGVIAPPPLIFGGAFVCGYLLDLVVPVGLYDVGFSFVIGWLLVAGAGIIGLSGIISLLRAGTNVDPHKPTTVLVVNGVYLFSRNPLYISLTLAYLGLAILLNMFWTLLTLPPALFIMHHGVILREERYLERKFGEQYSCYKSKVRRWL